MHKPFNVILEIFANQSQLRLHLKLFKTGAQVVRHARTISLRFAEVTVTGVMVRAILTIIRWLRALPSCA